VLSFVSAEGGKERDVLSGSEDRLFIMPYDAGLRVSPDGKKIVMAAKNWDDTVLINNYPTLQIWTTTIEGDNPRQITKPEWPYSDSEPSWSPDGKNIVFLRSKLTDERFDNSGETKIYTINSSGDDLKLLMSESERWVGLVNWSPDGKKIAYVTKSKAPPPEIILHVINVESKESTVVAKLSSSKGFMELVWSPDSKRIAFNDLEQKENIKIISLADGNTEDIETGLVDTEVFFLDWFQC